MTLTLGKRGGLAGAKGLLICERVMTGLDMLLKLSRTGGVKTFLKGGGGRSLALYEICLEVN